MTYRALNVLYSELCAFVGLCTYSEYKLKHEAAPLPPPQSLHVKHKSSNIRYSIPVHAPPSSQCNTSRGRMLLNSAILEHI